MRSRLQNILLPNPVLSPVVLPADIQYMRLALKAAREAAGESESKPVREAPIVTVLVCGENHFIACNLKETTRDPTAHAEVLALRKAAKALGRWRLGGTLYVTLEPCLMCTGAILEARVDRLVFGAWDIKAGACGSVYNVIEARKIRHSIDVMGGVCAEESARLLKDFFSARRHNPKKTDLLDCGEMAELG